MPRPPHWPAAVYDVPLAQALHDIGAGRRPWPGDPSKKRHHFLPRFVLAKFAVGHGESARVWQLDKTRGAPRRVRPDEAASRKRFYAVESNVSPHDNRIEDLLALVEGEAAPAVARLLEQPGSLTEVDRTTISMLLAFQERRTPYGIVEAGAAAESIGKTHMAALASDAEAFAAAWRTSGRSGTPSEVELARHQILMALAEDRIHLETQREQGLLMMMEAWLPIAETIDLMRWTLLRPAAGHRFTINDQGVARLDRSTTLTTPGRSPQWLFPLAPDACLYAEQGSRTLAIRGATTRGVRDINLRMYGWAERFLFGDSQHALDETRRQAKANPRRAAGPPAVPQPRPRKHSR